MRTHTDEWGGYSKPNWFSLQKKYEKIRLKENPEKRIGAREDEYFCLDENAEMKEDESLCKLVGIDIEKRL